MLFLIHCHTYMSHNRIIVLEDEEIALVVPEMSDLEVMTRGINHLENAKYVNLTMPRGVMWYKAEEEYLSGLISKPWKHNFMIMLKSDPWFPVVWSLGFHEISEFNRNVTLWIMLYGSYPWKWIGTRALNLLLCYGFEYLHLHKISLDVHANNERAIACYKSCWFQECWREREHIWSGDEYIDSISMEILRSEWKQISQK